ncbi:MAG: hypothetical protein V2I47_00425 [Bacteroidales bacterium]|nr:hypothetical protein [Bacteroidales bacterium]
MLMLLRISAFCIMLLATQVSNIENMSGPYLGQEPPGNEPVRFARNIIPDDLHSVPVFSADGKSMYVKSMKSEGILVSRENGGRWTTPALFIPGSDLNNSDDPCLSPVGEQLFFSSYDKQQNRDYIYYCDLNNAGSGNPRKPAGKLNDLDLHWQFSMAGNGTVYYAANGNIYCSELSNGVYLEPYKLDSCINSSYSECTPYISPEEDLLIFARSTSAKPDLYVSRKDRNGNWTEAQALPQGINTDHHEMCPRITADGKYFFFISSREGLFSAYWVDAKFIQKY